MEQKNWTHARKQLDWDRYDCFDAVEAINDLYRNELHDAPQTLLEHVAYSRRLKVQEEAIPELPRGGHHNGEYHRDRHHSCQQVQGPGVSAADLSQIPKQ